MRTKWISVLMVLFLLASLTSVIAKNVVVPTYYGYGVVNTRAAYVQPYISAFYPYAYPTYYNGTYNNTVPVAPVATAYAPAWNGSYWYYQSGLGGNVAVVSCNLNVRSGPSTGKNVIATLKGGEQAYVIAQSGNWYLVQSVVSPVRRGFVYGSYLKFYSNYWPVGNYMAYHPAPAYYTARRY